MSDIKVKNFDFQRELEKVAAGIRKPNILICGATGAGKSSVVNWVFGKNVAATGTGRPLTRGITEYSSEDTSVNLFDTEGYEIGEEKISAYRDTVEKWIGERREGALAGQIHEAWYCISAANKRVTDMDLSVVQTLQEKNIPTAVVLTQLDCVDYDEYQELLRAVSEGCGAPCFATSAHADRAVQEALAPYVQWDALVDWAEAVLDDSLKEGFIGSLAGYVQKKQALVTKKIIPIYTTAAAGVAATPIPFSDAVLLEPIQVSMAMHILRTYGLDKISEDLISFVGSLVVTQAGRMLAQSLTAGVLKMIPGVGTAAGIAVNTVVASTFTAAIGAGLSQSCANYSKAVFEGSRPQSYPEFFDSAILSGFVESWLKEHKNGKDT